ncbi:SDR family oxidoreductase [Clostridium estertheticum]|uniref:SDR family oxidoreductase n=1 Tax=Clostridium estertheticum TaxID=238834 RepID=A0AA47EFR1_9CLOT|nr:SDR family oxidoreductase [Clostridium estertheticum]MBU3156567.1 SDR family oxidoreductase [Clostridium estertheticum]MBU3201356.1 SDR family oxidoreductase [Clostridium estertheticum]MCB2354556.1 SDR family oxidoreductase [Clostridium estertheticum]MCB2358483.1 SDR family oxidoreductase [Clostridium estertheticum]WAG40806.1 SDR family oxidoreductase [Clostridium estertheticum]
MKLKEKIAIVTGAASGMGRSIAILYAQEGAKVVVSDIDLEGAKATVAEIEANGGSAMAVLTNVTKEKDIQNLIDTTVKIYGTVDILVNNAGIMDNMAGAADVTDELWDRIFAVNTTSVMRATRKVLPIFLTKGTGVIINIASVGGLRGSTAGAAYTASKHAVVGFTKNTGFQYAKEGIRCNAIAPGPIKTNISASMGNVNQRGAAICRTGMSTICRLGEPEEIAGVALFLATDDSKFVNGQVLAVDGGWTAY